MALRMILRSWLAETASLQKRQHRITHVVSVHDERVKPRDNQVVGLARQMGVFRPDFSVSRSSNYAELDMSRNRKALWQRSIARSYWRA